jgi:hypothetical protein
MSILRVSEKNGGRDDLSWRMTSPLRQYVDSVLQEIMRAPRGAGTAGSYSEA